MESDVILWYVLIGLVLVGTATLDVVFRKLPISTTMIYLGLGVAVGPFGLGLVDLDPLSDAKLIEHLAEIAVIVSLFAAGLKMRLPLGDRRWVAPILLASVAMVLTVAAVAAVGFWGIGLSLGAAILLGAVLAPTDPVLASEVQLNNADDRDRLRLTLTGEAGLNDGTAFPFVLLGIGLFAGGLHDLGTYGWRWWAIDFLWAVTMGLAVGWFAGLGVARLVIYLRGRFKESLTADEMLTVGMIALIYGLALAIGSYAFLAVFAAAVAIRREEFRNNQGRPAAEVNEEAAAKFGPVGESAGRNRAAGGEGPTDKSGDSDTAGISDDDVRKLGPAKLAHAQLRMTESAERLIEVMLVILVGALIIPRTFGNPVAWWFVPLVLFVIRPAIALASTWPATMSPAQRGLASWFGIRGIGSIYYLAHAFAYGVAEANAAEARLLADLVIATICASVVLHGISATPLMAWYATRRGSRPSANGAAASAVQ